MRVHNFYPGPSALPLSVLETVQAELLDFAGTGMSVLEMSHRSPSFISILEDTVERLKRHMRLGDGYEVVLMQGGGTLQFEMVPMNLSRPGGKVDYVDTGYWARKAIEEARLLKRDVAVVSAANADDVRLPDPDTIAARPGAAYLHLCSNNTIEGTQWQRFPKVDVPMVADMSSDILSKDMDYTAFGCIYAHAQKTLGPAGVTLVAIRKDLLDIIPEGLPSLLDYRTHVKHRSNYQTPPCFAIYMMWRMLEWLEQMGGVAAIEDLNRQKAGLLYALLDGSNFYRCAVEPGSRSAMNVVFRLPDARVEELFLKKAAENGLIGLGGHRSVGGCRASLYNAVPLASVQALVAFMADFEKHHG